MAKKKKKYLIKLNNKIRNYFQGRPFDEGVESLDDEKLIELMMLLEVQLPSFTKEEMVRTLRRIWSQEGAERRALIVSYLTKGYKAIHSSKTSSQTPQDKVEKILSLLSPMACSIEEENKILESFIDAKPSKITQEKIANKLSYFRMKEQRSQLESSLDIRFNDAHQMSFYHPFVFSLLEIDFTKTLLCQSESLPLPPHQKEALEAYKTTLEEIKESLIQTKQATIDRLCQHLKKEPHPYLTQKQREQILQTLPPEIEPDEAPIPQTIVESILSSIDPTISLFFSSEHTLLEKPMLTTLFGTKLPYLLKESYSNPPLYRSILQGEPLEIEKHFQEKATKEERDFKESIDALLEEMKALSEPIELPQESFESFILRFVVPQVRTNKNLKLKDKSRRRVLFHFHEYLKPLLEKQKREALLAQTIRDFKNLFPLARALKREIVFHVGPTNSGKTYQALKALKEASTGYYLAPLRLLALEGYEKLKEDGIHASLITGEEEIIDENSTHISSTIEMMNLSVDVDVCVIDEIQMISDRDRGWAWANALMGAPAKKVILTGSSNALPAVEELCRYLQEPLEVKYFERKNALEVLPTHTPIKEITPQTAIVAFSRKEVLALKQQLSANYQVSVVYGNLSPEVRKEEARRFREGESQILVSTDAIAMGLNLPIKTLLFAKDNKFDGLRRRPLLPTEVAQIAGRAGRYGFEEKGYVGALEKHALKHIDQAFHTPLPPIELPVSVMASLEHILLIGEILQTEAIEPILQFFADNMEFEGPFVAANIESMLEIATIVDGYALPLQTRYFLSCAPASLSSPYIESVFHRYIKQIEAQTAVRYIPPRDLPEYAQTNEMLLNAEDRVREISLYLWLSFKFPELFVDVEKALQTRVRLNQYIENSLRKGVLSKQCRKCGKTLDFSYRFSICEGCYSKNQRGYKRRASSQPTKVGYPRKKRH